MCERGRGSRKKFKRNGQGIDDGFGNWGGYMAAKRAKLLDQFHGGNVEKISDIFSGVKIMINGLTNPSASELKDMMAAHGGEFHMYQVSSTTHIIASNLPNVKIKHLGAVPIVKPAWITESIALGKLLDYKRYLLYSNQSKSQPALNFPVVPKTSSSAKDEEEFQLTKENYFKSETNKSINRESTGSSFTAADKPIETKECSLANTAGRGTKTASDPKFLEEFYSNSRLHLISTLGAEFKQLVGQLREKSNGVFLSKEFLMSEKGKPCLKAPAPPSVIMHIDMDCFFVSVGLRNHPELKGKPVAITHAKSGVIGNNDPVRQASRQKEFEMYQERLPEGAASRVADIKDHIDGLASLSEIASCSYEARKYGIKNGMFMGQAIKLCPDLKTLPYDFEGYKEVSNTLYNTVASYTLDIEAVSCDEMYVDVRQVLVDTGLTVEEWASHIRNKIMTLTGCPCSTGFGANRLQARLATRRAKPAGQYYLKPDDVESYMSAIPVADLPGVGRATLLKLQNLGLNTCGDVQIVSLKSIQSELGTKQGQKIRDQAFGRDNKPLDFNHERKSVSAEVNYGIRFKTKDECYNFLQSLSNEVFSRLSDVGMKARGLTLKLLIRAAGAPVETAKFLGHGVCDAISKSCTSNVIFSNSDIIYREAKTIYDKLNVPFSELRGVGIQLTKLEKNAHIHKALSNFLKQGTVKLSNIENQLNLQNSEEDISRKKSEDIKITTKNALETRNERASFPESNPLVKNDLIKKNVSTINKHSTETKTKNVKLSINVSSIKSLAKEVNNSKSKGRGRPQGSKTKSTVARNVSKVGRKENPMMDNFLGKSRRCTAEGEASNTTGIGINLELLRLREQIDINVLNELPEDIRKEIMKEYQFDIQPKPKISNAPAQENNQNTIISLDGEKKSKIDTANKTQTQKQTTTKRSPFSRLSWEQIKPVIKTWIRAEREPAAVDVEMLADHLRQLALDRKIEVLQSGFRFLHRVFSDLSCEWHQAYFAFVNAVQQGMVARYGRILLVESDFSCCQIQ